MEKIKIIKENVSENGVSFCAIETPRGVFFGKSTLLEEDKKFPSLRYGGENAYIKAYLKYVKAREKEEKLKEKTLKDCYFALTQCKDVNIHSPEMQRMRKQLKASHLNVLNWKNRYDKIHNNFLERDSHRVENIEKFHKDLQQKKEKINKDLNSLTKK